ncbi:MAG: LysR substrate-binding domain-containing protein [Burkholderiaceae bacterium]
METKWLEDFVSLAETRSFSRSALLRHVTQPAFSRRIQSLEAWAGTDLVDRSSYPTRLTPAGQTLYEQALDMLHSLQSTRAMLRAHTAAAQDVIEFAVPHTLAFTFFPSWLSGLRGVCRPIKSRLIALNVHDAVMRLVEGSCDLLIAYHHATQPIQLDAARYEMLLLGRETFSPYVRPDEHGQPLFALPGTAAQPLPYLAYAPGAYLGRVLEQVLKQNGSPLHLDRIYETDMAEGLKAMALEGHGVAFLPSSAVRREVRSRRLISAGAGFDTGLEIRIYRERSTAARTKGSVETFWRDLERHVEQTTTSARPPEAKGI